jgi:nicotinamide phosphoribosyltransferase
METTMLNDNLILRTDSYKLTHWNQYPPNTTGVYSYFESRKGAEFTDTVFFGLQPILRSLSGSAVSADDVNDAAALALAHFGNETLFNREGWMHIVNAHDGRLPVRIKAVPEGTVVPEGNVLMTVENTDPKCYWLTNAIESVLTHVWYPSTVASLSRSVKLMLMDKLLRAGAPLDGLPFMLHDFGYRGATTDDAAAIGGAAHLVNFLGTDTLPAMALAVNEYGAKLNDLAFSVPATEHSVMTAEGEDREWAVFNRLLRDHPTGILSVVADSYNIYDFVSSIVASKKDEILARDGKLVVRPDSITTKHPTPGLLVVDLLERLWTIFGGSANQKGYRVLDPHIGLLWGDGIDRFGIEKIVNGAMAAGFSPENLVFGMGGGLLQKVNRDTQRFAFKSSAQKRNGVWYDIQKKPLDASKASKPGRLMLVNEEKVDGSGREWRTAGIDAYHAGADRLETVFEDGHLPHLQSFASIRARAANWLPTQQLAIAAG